MAKRSLAPLLLAVALGVVFVGIRYRIIPIVALTALGVGLYSLAAGLRMIATRRADLPTSVTSAHIERYRGRAAQLQGFLFAAFGVLLSVGAIGGWLYPDELDAWIRDLPAHPAVMGALLLGAGVLVGAHGLSRLSAGDAAFVETRLPPAQRVLGGAYFLLVGVGMIGFGLVQIRAPGLLTLLRARLGELLRDWLAH